MAETPSVESVETEEEFIHVRFRDPDEFDTIRTPDWAENVSPSVNPPTLPNNLSPFPKLTGSRLFSAPKTGD